MSWEPIGSPLSALGGSAVTQAQIGDRGAILALRQFRRSAPESHLQVPLDPRFRSSREHFPPVEGAHREDWQLVQSVLSGSKESKELFGKRMACVAPLLVARNRRFSDPLSRDELLDLAQDVQLRVWNNLGRFRGESRIETWVYGFCRFCMMKFIEKRRTRAEREAIWKAEKKRSGGELASGSSRKEPAPHAFDALLDQLSEREAQVTRLRHAGHLEFGEIAKAIGVSASTAKTHYYRALKKLRPLLERSGRVGHK